MSNLVANKSAIEFRKEYGLGECSPINVYDILKRSGVITVFKPLKNNFSGMVIKTKKNERFMLINSTHPLGKQNFTICHELYHLFIQNNFSAQTCQTGRFDKKDREEYNADIFASYLLIPKDAILELTPKEELRKDRISLQTILSIEQKYRCSRAALLFKLHEMDLISEDYKQQFTSNKAKLAVENGHSSDLYKAANDGLFIGDGYRDLAEELFKNLKISESHYIGLMGDVGIELY